MNQTTRTVETTLFVLILLAGAALRLSALGRFPSPEPLPEEASHVADAEAILAGEGRLIFGEEDSPREPLWAYVAAAVMSVAGPGLASARLASALFGIALLVVMYIWVRVATQNSLLALAAMAGLAVSGWSVATSREAVSDVAFPLMYMLAALFLRRGLHVEEDVADDFVPRMAPRTGSWLWFGLAGLALGLSFYAHPVAQVMWLAFPVLLVHLWLTQPGSLRRAWRGALLMFAVGALVAAPVATAQINAYGAAALSEVRESLGTLQEAARSVTGVVGVWGDRVERAPRPGTPLLGPVVSILYYVGASVALLSVLFPYRPARRGHRSREEAFRITSANVFMLLTVALGFAPLFVAGASGGELPVIGLQPAVYYFPALAVLWMSDSARRHIGRGGITALSVAYGVVLLIVMGLTIGATF